MTRRPIRLGVAGLGRAFVLMLPAFVRHPGVKLVACADPRAAARDCFMKDFGGHAYDTVEALCTHPEVEAIYLSTPHQYHAAHVRMAAAAGKHVIVEKPMALSLDDCQVMINDTRAAGVHLMVGHSHSYDLPYLKTVDLIRTGEFGTLQMITALNCTDYLYRPRRPEELVTAAGGGAIFNQAPHQIEIIRLLANSPIKSIRAATSVWDRRRPTEGAYTAFLAFENGVAASITYNGHGHFDSDALNGWIGELGQARDPEAYGEARALLETVSTPEEEVALKNKRAYGITISAETVRSMPLPIGYNHFGFITVACTHGTLRPLPNAIEVYGDMIRRTEPLPTLTVPRGEVIDELAAAIIDRSPPLHTGEWGMETIKACLALLESARTRREVFL